MLEDFLATCCWCFAFLGTIGLAKGAVEVWSQKGTSVWECWLFGQMGVALGFGFVFDVMMGISIQNHVGKLLALSLVYALAFIVFRAFAEPPKLPPQ